MKRDIRDRTGKPCEKCANGTYRKTTAGWRDVLACDECGHEISRLAKGCRKTSRGKGKAKAKKT